MNQQIRDNLAYHYTSLETALKIIEGVRDGSFIFHASSIFCLNDPTEMKYGYERVMEIFPKIENMLGIYDDKYKLSKLWEKDKRFSPVEWQEIHLSKHKMFNQHVFTISLSLDVDDEMMWKCYGNNGNGIALGFDTRMYPKYNHKKAIVDFTHIDFKKLYSFNVEYGKMPFFSLPYIYVVKKYKEYWEKIQKITIMDDIIDTQIDYLSDIVEFVTPFIKDRKYKEEKESRIIALFDNIRVMKTKFNPDGHKISYIEVNIPSSYLKRIVIGCCCDYEKTRKQLLDLLLRKKITHEIEIMRSSVPYRR